jgi:predicted signal transduction protein with EAL and GGDEF domain
MLEEVRRPFLIEGHEIHVSGSLGLAIHPEDGTDAETLLKNADAAMYHAKELGRNSFRFFSAELAARRAERLQMEVALRRALKGNELELHYQPIVEVATGEVLRAEALLRWHDPERGLMLPFRIHSARRRERPRATRRHWVLDGRVQQARAWRDRASATSSLCVNLSPAQLRDTTDGRGPQEDPRRAGLRAGLAAVRDHRDEHGARRRGRESRASRSCARSACASRSTTSAPASRAFRTCATCRSTCSRSTRASSPTSTRRAAASPNLGGAAIVSAVIGLAHGLGLDVVAEGVERPAQLEYLERAGCRSCQGYLLCPPLPAPEFETWLSARREKKTAAAPKKAKAAKAPAKKKVTK